MILKPKVSEIKTKRKALGLSKHQVSILARLGGSSFCRIENETVKQVRWHTGKAIAEVLKCDMEEIFELVGENHNEK